MCQYKAGGFPHLTYVDKEKTVADVNDELATARCLIDTMASERDALYTDLKDEIIKLKRLLRRALTELAKQERLIMDEIDLPDYDLDDKTLGEEIRKVLTEDK